VSLPFSDYCYPVFDDEHVLERLADEIVLLAQAEGLSLVELQGEHQNSSSLHKHSEHVIHKVVLESDIDKVSRRIHEMHRCNINIAKKNNVQIVFGSTHEHVFEFYKFASPH
jgi:hypothetical protein